MVQAPRALVETWWAAHVPVRIDVDLRTSEPGDESFWRVETRLAGYNVVGVVPTEPPWLLRYLAQGDCLF